MNSMKVLFIEARKKFGQQKINYSALDKLPGQTISLASTLQYLSLIPKVKEYLEKKQKKVIIKQGAYYKSQVLGCNPSAFDKNADSLLLITDGKFHALNNAVQLNKEIYVFNTYNLEKITNQDIEKIRGKKQAKVKKFLTSTKIGILTSTKQGQNYKNSIELKKRIEKMEKQAYIFESDNIDLLELENFNIQMWVNTACPGIDLDNPKIVNLQDIMFTLK
ncbi:MAG: diphthamide synthesis protein [Nanoarchaeota archaeon]|nr:diphthamide synthesis protein [Nanoarchaeota archaeon]